MRKVYFLFSLWLCSVAAFAQRGVCGVNAKWVLNEEGTLTISGEGEMYDYSPNEPSWDLYKEQIKSVVVNGVTNVGNNAFYDYPNIISVRLGEGLKNIGNNAFKGCKALKELSVPGTVETYGERSFADCISLKELTIPENVSNIGTFAFADSGLEKIYWNAIECTVNVYGTYYYSGPFNGCQSLAEVHFGEKVKSVPGYSLKDCGALTTITTHNTIEKIGEQAFEGTYWLNSHDADQMVYIDHVAYKYIDFDDGMHNKPITLDMPEGTTCISPWAISNNKRLVKVIIPTTMKYLGYGAFEGCSALGEVVYNAIEAETEDSWFERFPNSLWAIHFGDKVKRIPKTLLYNCEGLEEIVLPESLEFIGEGAFQGCNTVKELVIPNNVNTIEHRAISYMANLEKVTIGEGLTNLANYSDYSAFDECPKLHQLIWNAVELDQHNLSPYNNICAAPLETLVLGDKVKSVPKSLVKNSTTLHSVTFGKSVETIGNYAFTNCGGLTEVELPNSLKVIGSGAFEDTNIEKFFLPQNIERLGYEALNSQNTKSIIIPSSNIPVAEADYLCKEEVAIYVPDVKGYKEKSYAYRNVQPMLTATPDEYIYDGTTPAVSFACNMPGYETASIGEAQMEQNAGEHQCKFTVSFKGEREFTVDYVYSYVINKGKQTIEWEQSFDDVHAGDKIELKAVASSGIDIDYYCYNYGVEIKKEDGKTYLTGSYEGEITVYAKQEGDDNWEAAEEVYKTFQIQPTGITGITLDEAEAVDVYTLDGRKTSAPQKGLHIIRHSDGKVSKKIIK